MFDKKKFLNEGYSVIKNVIKKELIYDFNKDIENILSLSKGDSTFDEKFISYYKNFINRKKSYILMQDLQSVKMIASHINKFLNNQNIYEELNFITPSIKNALLISLPDETKYDNPFHQDIYNYHSNRFIKLWVPLTKVNNVNGSMELFKKSHELGFINPEYKKLSYYPEVNVEKLDKYESKIFDLEPGPIIIFNPLLIHRSVPNLSKKVRFTLGCDIQDVAGIPLKNDESSMIYKMEKISKERKNRRQNLDY